MYRVVLRVLGAGALFAISAPLFAAPLTLNPGQYGRDQSQAQVPAAAEPAPVRYAAARSNMGGGFIEALFGALLGDQPRYQTDRYAMPSAEPVQTAMDLRYLRQVVDYTGDESAGTIVIDTRGKFLYLVQPGGKALRYGVGVGRPGFLWAGVKHISQKREWPDWTPPPEMLQRRPDLPRHMEGGPENPLGARAMYLGSSLYRIHGSNEPWTIGTNVSSGCIRMRNEDVVDLYERVKVGTKVIVM